MRQTMRRLIRAAFFAAAALPAVFPVARILGQTAYEEAVMEESDGAAAAAERLDALRGRPIDLNRAGVRELRTLPLLSPHLAEAVAAERRKSGPFRDLEDFRLRLGLDRALAEALAPYTVVGAAVRGGRPSASVRLRARREFPEADGFRNGTYAESGLQTLAKAEIRGKTGIAAGILTEKDPGERRWNDHISGYASLPAADGRLRFTLGDFTAEAGQGLVLWGPYAPAAGSDPIGSACRSAGGLTGVASSFEGVRFSGLAAEWSGAGQSAAVFGSTVRLDATVSDSGAVTSIRTTGLHRTESEIRGRGACREDALAGRWTGRFGRVSAGGTLCWTRYGRALNFADPERRPFGFSGRGNWTGGADWDASFHGLRFCGEWAVCRGGGMGRIASLSVRRGGAEWCLSGRKTGADFHGPAESGSGNGSNETAWYAAFRGRLAQKWTAEGYAQLIRHPDKTWFDPLPSSESECGIQASRDFGSGTVLRIRLRFRDRGDAEAEGGGSPGTSRSLRLELEAAPERALRIRCRADAVACGASAGRGYALFEEMRWEPRRGPAVTGRWTLYDTDSWDSRVVAYESDWPGSFSMVPLYKKGRRWLVHVRWPAFSGMTVSVKAAGTVHAFSESWGSGPDRIRGGSEWTVGTQIDWRMKYKCRPGTGTDGWKARKPAVLKRKTAPRSDRGRGCAFQCRSGSADPDPEPGSRAGRGGYRSAVRPVLIFFLHFSAARLLVDLAADQDGGHGDSDAEKDLQNAFAAMGSGHEFITSV
jgi:hypothetical protein